VKNSPPYFLRCVAREDQVAVLNLLVAGEAGFHKRVVNWLAVAIEMTEPPATVSHIGRRSRSGWSQVSGSTLDLTDGISHPAANAITNQVATAHCTGPIQECWYGCV
jgi:hypothetical protein